MSINTASLITSPHSLCVPQRWGGYFESVRETLEDGESSWEKMIALDPVFAHLEKIENSRNIDDTRRILEQISGRDRNKLNSPFLDAFFVGVIQFFPHNIVESRNLEVLKFCLKYVKAEITYEIFALLCSEISSSEKAQICIEELKGTSNLMDIVYKAIMEDHEACLKKLIKGGIFVKETLVLFHGEKLRRLLL